MFTLEAPLNKRRELQRLDGIIEIFTKQENDKRRTLPIYPFGQGTADKFIDNCFNENCNGHYYESLEHLLVCLKSESFSEVLNGSFNWGNSPEEHLFWSTIYGKFVLEEQNKPKPIPSTADTIFELLDKLKAENREEYREVLDLLYSKTMEELYLDSGIEHEH